MIDWNCDTARSPLFRLIALASILLGLYSLRFLLVGWTVPMGGHVFFLSSPAVAADLATVPWPSQLLRLLVVVGDFALPLLVLRKPRWALYLAPALLIAAQAGWIEATISGGSYAAHTAVTDGSSVDWTELLDWLKLVLRLLVVGGVSYFVLTKTTISR